MFADPVPDGAIRQAGVGLFVATSEVGDFGAVDVDLPLALAMQLPGTGHTCY